MLFRRDLGFGLNKISFIHSFIHSFRAKTIKNVVVVNEELTAEEWKRRWEREREKVLKLRAQVAAAEKELERWRKGIS